MNQQKLLFIYQHTLIKNDNLEMNCLTEQFNLSAGIIPALYSLKQAGFQLILLLNEPNLSDTNDSFAYWKILIDLLSSQGISFVELRSIAKLVQSDSNVDNEILANTSTQQQHSSESDPLFVVTKLLDFLQPQTMDQQNSYVIADNQSDAEIANYLGISPIRLGAENSKTWTDISKQILTKPRIASITRKTKETEIIATVNLDDPDHIAISTGIGFFDHMLEQLAKHGGFSLTLQVSGDLDIDDHHSVEDSALVLGAALRKALGDKLGIARYGFLLPMDEALSQIAIDLSGRPYCIFKGKFEREQVGQLATELVPHFFHSFAQTLGATLHIDVRGENTHHMIEAVFKGVGRALRQALHKTDHDNQIPSSKGIL